MTEPFGDRADALDEASAFDASGHGSDLALSLLADGADDLVPLAAREHTDQCPACTERLGEFVVLSLSVEGALQVTATAAHRTAKVRFPTAAYLAVLGIPALHLARQWSAGDHFAHERLHQLFDWWRIVAPLGAALDRAARSLDHSLPLSSALASLTFVLLGLVVVRLVRPITLQGPVS